MKIIELDKVSKFYNGDRALDALTLNVTEGERVVILGPSGCGKTTVLRLIAGLSVPDRGTITLAGEVVSQHGRIIKQPEARNIGMVFQDLALWPHLTVLGNLAFGLKARGISKTERAARIGKMLELVGLKGYEKRKPAELSGGQQQRVALARALALEPQVLLMDEPLSSLDFELNLRLRNEVLRLQKELGFTLLYVTHDRDEAFSLATRVVLLNKGKMAFEGTAAEAREHFKIK